MHDKEYFTGAALRNDGFQGFVPFADLPGSGVPDAPGVYIVLRTGDEPPLILDSSCGGRFKGRDPVLPQSKLIARWHASSVLYIGKAEGQTLRRRLDQYRRFGAGEPIGHWGGRAIWQLADRDELLVAWKVVPAGAAAHETELLAGYEVAFGRLPFANLRR